MRAKTLTSVPDKALLSAVLLLYYGDRLKQKAIASQLRIGVATVNRLLAEGRKQGLVEFKLTLPIEDKAAGQVRQLFPAEIPNPQAIVVPSKVTRTLPGHLAAVSVAGARCIESVLKQDYSISIDGGESVAGVVQSIQSTVRGLKLYPVAGGPQLSPLSSVLAVIGRFLGKYGPSLGLEPHFLPPPRDYKKTPLNRDEKKILRESTDADVFLLGVGAISAQGSTTANELLRSLDIDKQELIGRGIVGVSAYSTFDGHGNPTPSPFDDRVAKVPPQTFLRAARSRKKNVIAVACGKEKARAIKALIRGGWVNCIVTDAETANAIWQLK